MIKRFYLHHQRFWIKKNIKSLCVSALFLLAAFIFQKLANAYVANLQGIAVGDLVLDHLPPLDIAGLIIIVTVLFTLVPVILGIYKPKYLNLGLKLFAVFIIVRSLSISLTHLGASPEQITFAPDAAWFRLYDFLYNTQGDFFFSGHTGIPFLFALVFWPERVWRYFFLATSAFFGALVLLAHLHYSIDVFAAPFMTYGIYSFGIQLFAHDYKISLET